MQKRSGMKRRSPLCQLYIASDYLTGKWAISKLPLSNWKHPLPYTSMQVCRNLVCIRSFASLALVYQRLGRLDSALWFAQKGYELSLKPNIWSRFICFSASVLGFIHTAAGNYEQAKKYLFIGTVEAKKVNNIFFLSWNYNLLRIFLRKQMFRIPVFIMPVCHSHYGVHITLATSP